MLSPGTTLHGYTLEQLVGTGGMGSIWAARDGRSGAAVALKFLRPGGEAAECGRERLIREARATRRILHPAIVPTLDVLDHEGAPVLVMELLQGETLRERLERVSQLSLEQAATVMLPIANALAAAHAHGIVHRDLKPENIFIEACSAGIEGSNPAMRLLDFGIARFREPAPDAEGAPITGLDTLLGTVYYMAPEQALRPSESDGGVDIWAFGVTLYEALSGCRPIEGLTAPDALRQLLVGAITPIQFLRPDLPAELSALIGQMLVRNPERRASSLSGAIEVLGRYVSAS
jgi:serine/threonine-protein kinase